MFLVSTCELLLDEKMYLLIEFDIFWYILYAATRNINSTNCFCYSWTNKSDSSYFFLFKTIWMLEKRNGERKISSAYIGTKANKKWKRPRTRIDSVCRYQIGSTLSNPQATPAQKKLKFWRVHSLKKVRIAFVLITFRLSVFCSLKSFSIHWYSKIFPINNILEKNYLFTNISIAVWLTFSLKVMSPQLKKVRLRKKSMILCL